MSSIEVLRKDLANHREYIELLKNSKWKKIPKAHSPVFCSDNTIWGGLDLTTL